MDSQMDVPQLYDDFFIILYDYLNLREKIRLSQTCTSLENLFVQYVDKKMPRIVNNKLIVELKELSTDDMQFFWRHYGPCVESIEFSDLGRNFRTICDVPNYKYLTKVQRLTVSTLWRINYSQFLNPSNIRTITEVNIRDRNFGDDEMQLFISLQYLEKLSLSKCNITGKYINRMRRLNHLSLRSCCNLVQQNLVKICADLKLRYLDICNTYGLVLNEIVSYCGDLKVLKFSWDVNFFEFTHYDIAVLPKLKSLTIYLTQWHPLIIDELYFRMLSKYHRDDLEEVTISLFKERDYDINVEETAMYQEILKYFQTIFQKGFYGLSEFEECENSIMKFRMDECF